MDLNYGDLNRMIQEDLDTTIESAFSSTEPSTSAEGSDFIWRCLRVDPEVRMTAIEAECHDWFCVPEDHLEFFRQLDRRMLMQWNIQRQLKPLPWELPDLQVRAKVPPGN
jgi:serine/threonine protein kinase